MVIRDVLSALTCSPVAWKGLASLSVDVEVEDRTFVWLFPVPHRIGG